MKIVSSAATDVGRTRQVNEDAYLEHHPLFVIADGMGGHVAGDVASATAIETIQQGWNGSSDIESITSMIKQANRAIFEKARTDPNLSGMGTTCTAVLLDGSAAHVAHVGDSRAYLFRDGELSQVTEDHTVVGRMEREGKLTAEEAHRHPHRNIITRALGIEDDVEVDTWELELVEGDRLVICSDGLNSMLDDTQIRETLLTGEDATTAARSLVDAANNAGGEDNITVIVLDAVPDDYEAPAPPPPPEQAEVAREDTAPDPRYETQMVATPPPPRRRWRRLVWSLVVLALILALAVGAARWALANSWYVGLNDEGYVTIYQGIPDEVASLTLKEAETTTEIHVDDLPEFRREDVREGIKVDSEDQAQETVDNLEREVTESEPEPQRKKN